jgi:hypothetical protein
MLLSLFTLFVYSQITSNRAVAANNMATTIVTLPSSSSRPFFLPPNNVSAPAGDGTGKTGALAGLQDHCGYQGKCKKNMQNHKDNLYNFHELTSPARLCRSNYTTGLLA